MPANLNNPFVVNREMLAWAAGIFEGEGSFSAHRTDRPGRKRDRSMSAKVKMADEDVVRKFHSIIKVGNVRGPYKCDGAGQKPLWVWQVGSFEGVQVVMSMLWPWLHKRRRTKIKELLNQYHNSPRQFGPQRN